MKLYRRLIPKMAKDIVRAFNLEKAILIEEGKRDVAELDVASALVDYINKHEALVSDAHDQLAQHGLPQERYGAYKRMLADQRGLKIGDESTDQLLDMIVESLFKSKNVAEVFAEDHELRRISREALSKYAGVDEDLDKEVRQRLRNMREGTAEWDIEYQKLIQQFRRLKGMS